MTGKRIPQERKLALLQLIKEKKAILFGKFSNELTHGINTAAWEEVVEKARALEIVSATKDSAYVRDSVWGVWRARTLLKKDNKGKTGTGGGRANALNELDHAILDIVGKDSVVVNGLPIGESGDFVPTNDPVQLSSVDYADGEGLLENFRNESNIDVGVSSSSVSPPTSKPNESESSKLKKRKLKKPTEDNLSSERRKLQCDLLKIKIYKHRLETLKLEMDLGLTASEFTKDLWKRDSDSE